VMLQTVSRGLDRRPATPDLRLVRSGSLASYCTVPHLRQRFLKLRVKPRIPAATNGTGETVAISALLEPTSGLLRSPVTKSAPSLTSPPVAHRCNSPSSPRAQAAQAPEPRTTSRIPMVRMSSVSVPDPGEKNRLGARIIAAPTAIRAAATNAKIRVDTWGLSRITARPYSRCNKRPTRLPPITVMAAKESLCAVGRECRSLLILVWPPVSQRPWLRTNMTVFCPISAP